MFKFRNNNQMPDHNNNPHGFYGNNQFERLMYQLQETNRKLKNLNNRLKRVENFLGLRNEDKFDVDAYYED